MMERIFSDTVHIGNILLSVVNALEGSFHENVVAYNPKKNRCPDIICNAALFHPVFQGRGRI